MPFWQVEFAISEKCWCPARLSRTKQLCCTRCSMVSHTAWSRDSTPKNTKKHQITTKPSCWKARLSSCNLLGYLQDSLMLHVLHWNHSELQIAPLKKEKILYILNNYFKSTLVLHRFSAKNPEFEETHMDHPSPAQTTQRSNHVPSKLNLKIITFNLSSNDFLFPTQTVHLSWVIGWKCSTLPQEYPNILSQSLWTRAQPPTYNWQSSYNTQRTSVLCVCNISVYFIYTDFIATSHTTWKKSATILPFQSQDKIPFCCHPVLKHKGENK